MLPYAARKCLRQWDAPHHGGRASCLKLQAAAHEELANVADDAWREQQNALADGAWPLHLAVHEGDGEDGKEAGQAEDEGRDHRRDALWTPGNDKEAGQGSGGQGGDAHE